MTAHRPQPPHLVPALTTFAVSAIIAYAATMLGAIALALAATVVAGLAITALLLLATARERRGHPRRRGIVPY